eukprot:5470853-Alexandrium_andersonii.AAC.1
MSYTPPCPSLGPECGSAPGRYDLEFEQTAKILEKAAKFLVQPGKEILRANDDLAPWFRVGKAPRYVHGSDCSDCVGYSAAFARGLQHADCALIGRGLRAEREFQRLRTDCQS